MPRTLPSALSTAMDNGAYEPYLRVHLNTSPTETGEDSYQPIAFRLGPLDASITIPYAAVALDEGYFRIERGALIDGSAVTISSIWFNIIEFEVNGKEITYTGHILDRSYLTVNADSDYETVIETTLTDIGPNGQLLTPNYEGTAAWKAYQFYPDGKVIVISPRTKLFTILRQKYLIFASEDGWDGSTSNVFFFVATQTRSQDYVVVDPLCNFNFHTETRKLIWRDEANTVHTKGGDTNPLYNLGYLESTADDPADLSSPFNIIGTRTRKLPVHLKYRTGDSVRISNNSDVDPDYTLLTRVKVTEVLDTKSTPSWYQILEALEYFSGTEGGPLPSTIEAAAPYTPLVTGNFDGILSSNDNNLQAAMETIDDHTHGEDITTTEEIQDIAGGMFSGNTETGITATYDDANGKIDLELTAKAEINSADLFRVSNAGNSTFVGTIATLPGGANLTYNVSSGNENAMVPNNTNQLAKMRLYNTTRGTNALISNCNTGTNTITLTANVPAGWQVGDTIDIASQTVSGGTGNWVDLEITSGFTGRQYMFLNVQWSDNGAAAATNIARLHPFETFANAKVFALVAQVSSFAMIATPLVTINNNMLTVSWITSGAASGTLLIRGAGYLY